jgi:ATP-dependent exoDNAse (exonuclease V) beta subunit
MAFLHNNRFERFELETVETDDGRFYKTPGGLYESITTALGRNEEKKKSLEQWQQRVGIQEARRISRVSATRGTSLHKIAEDYLNNNPHYERGKMPDAIAMFRKLKPILDKSITQVYMQECPLFSYEYKLAGRCDLIAEVLNQIAICDFKNSLKPKKREWIHDYFLQTAAYSFMFEEMYGMRVHLNLILISVENGEPQIFMSDPYKYKKDPFFANR